jgi:hypothetical protein
MHTQTLRKSIITALVIIAAATVVALGGRYLILQGAGETVIAPQSQDAQIKQALVSAQNLSDATGSITGDSIDDIIITDTTIIEGGKWLIADVTTKGEDQQTSSAVFRQDDNRWELALTPGTSFNKDSLEDVGLPRGVINILDSKGRIDDAVTEEN